MLYAPLHLSSGSGLLRPSQIFSVPSFRYSSLSSLHRFWNEYFAYPLPNGSKLLHRLMVQILHLCIVHTLFIPRIHIQTNRLATRSIPELPLRLDILQFSYLFLQQPFQHIPAKHFISHRLTKHKIIRNRQFLISFCHSCSPLTRLQENKQRQYVEQTLCPSSSPTLLY